MLQATLAELPVSTESVGDTGKEVQDLVLSLETPQPPAQHTSMLNIDLDLMVKAQDETIHHVNEDKPVAVEHETVSTAQALSIDSSAVNGLAIAPEWLAAREQSENDIKQLLEKLAIVGFHLLKFPAAESFPIFT